MDFFRNTGGTIREEFKRLLEGDEFRPGIGRPMTLRTLTDTHCACWDGPTGSPTPNCAFCQGEGYLFRERRVTGYLVLGVKPMYKAGFQAQGELPWASYGVTDPTRCSVYTFHNYFKDYKRWTKQEHRFHDKLYELQVKDDGSLYKPVIRTAEWKILTVVPHHGEFGRVEYIELSCSKENV